MEINIALLTVTDTRTIKTDKSGGILVQKIQEQKHKVIDRKIAKDKPTEFDPRKFAIPGMNAMQDLCADRFERFGTAGHATKIKAVPLDKMASSYANGELKQT